MTNYILEVDSLTKTYGRFPALNGLTMRVPERSIYGFVGRNGAGKTTLIRLICGLQKPSSGSFTLCGIPHDSADIATARRRIGAVVEAPALYMDMSASVACLFAVITLLCGDRTRAILLCMGIAFAMLFLCLHTHQVMVHPEVASGPRRTVYGILHDLNPCGQAAQLSAWQTWNPLRMALCDLLWIAGVPALGCVLFDKKDLQ